MMARTARARSWRGRRVGESGEDGKGGKDGEGGRPVLPIPLLHLRHLAPPTADTFVPTAPEPMSHQSCISSFCDSCNYTGN